ncbi:MAG: DNA methyltransferase [Elusimicrobia bacterium RIFCSPLOWO2_12_FULL_59_9]|nr:MAG: DNA methyltransferase [Elusimicrobia bacterium RIFCSPLOWO2_12_FULL_59_9]
MPKYPKLRRKVRLLRDSNSLEISPAYSPASDVVLFQGDCLDLLASMPPKSVHLVVTSPPYNIGKVYEKRISLEKYLEQQEAVIKECVRVLSDTGSICWQVGNYIGKDGIVPLDIPLYSIFTKLGLRMRNRIIWHFEHGLHCSKRFSGRYETINWFTKSTNYVFNLDPVRIPQKYPNKKYFKGPKAGQPSCNPLGKNPGDLWAIPNVKHNHVEKTAHPCQFPVELIERLVLALTSPGNLVFDPFMGVGTTAIAAALHKRRAIGAEIVPEYIKLAKQRILMAAAGALRTRPMHRPIYDPNNPQMSRLYSTATHSRRRDHENQLRLLERGNGHTSAKKKELAYA